MKVISGGRGTGKTTRLFKEISEEYKNPVVVCRNPKHMIEKAYDMNIHNIRFITIDDLLENGTDNYEEIFFDDVYDVLVDLFGIDKVKGFTVII